MGQTVQPGPVFLQPRSPGQIVSPLLKQVAVILNPVVKAAPALIDPLYVMAQVKYLSGEPASAHLFSHRPRGVGVAAPCLRRFTQTHTHPHQARPHPWPPLPRNRPDFPRQQGSLPPALLLAASSLCAGYRG